MIHSKNPQARDCPGQAAFHVFLQKTHQILIGKHRPHCGNKDHATVLHACRTVNNLVETDKQFRQFVEELDKRIKL